MLFLFHDRFVELENGSRDPLPLAFVVGQHTRPIRVAATGATGIVVVNFFPWGAAPFIDTDLDEFKNASINLAEFYDEPFVNEVLEKVHSASSVRERVELVEEFLLANLNRSRFDSLIVEGVKTLGAETGVTSISSLASDLEISRRHLIRRFKSNIGLSPKEFANIVRFQSALNRLISEGDTHTTIAECGYYDQPHFIKDIKRYTGHTPSQLLGNTPASNLGAYFNRGSSPSHFYNTKYL